MDTNGSLLLWDVSTSGYESVRFLWFERRQIKPATFLLHFSLILWITDENLHLHFHQIFESFPLHCVSASLKYLYVHFQEPFFPLLLLLFRVIFFSCETSIYFLFFAALTFVLSSVWAVLGFYPRFFLNGCLSSLDEGVSGAGPQRSFLHVENASFVVSWITTTWIPRWRCSLLLEWRFRFYPNLWAINTTSSWYVHNLVHNYFIDVKCLM